MNTVLHLLIATTLIAGMILLRVFTDRESKADGDCGQTGCCRGCNIDEEPDTRTSRGA
jgi:hypothetical protein